jgi:hypothetical protein
MPFSNSMNALGLTPEEAEVYRLEQMLRRNSGTMSDRAPSPPGMTPEERIQRFQELYRGDWQMHQWLQRYHSPHPNDFPMRRRSHPPDNIPGHPRRFT